MMKKTGVILILFFIMTVLSGCNDREELEKRLSEAEHRLSIAEKRAEMAEQRALLVEKQRDELKKEAIRLGYISEDWK